MWNKLGFSIQESKADVTAILMVAGRQFVRTKRSHGAAKLHGQIPMFIRQQMYLSEPEFRDAVRCPLTRELYLEILCRKGKLDPETCRTLGLSGPPGPEVPESSAETW